MLTIKSTRCGRYRLAKARSASCSAPSSVCRPDILADSDSGAVRLTWWLFGLSGSHSNVAPVGSVESAWKTHRRWSPAKDMRWTSVRNSCIASEENRWTGSLHSSCVVDEELEPIRTVFSETSSRFQATYLISISGSAWLRLVIRQAFTSSALISSFKRFSFTALYSLSAALNIS